jgi:3-oxoacyl-[acyl-carrier protein] reductase
MNALPQPPVRRIAIVTGAARGIGAAIALRLASDGHDIAVIDLDADACAQTVADIEALGRKAAAISCDVANEGMVKAAVADTVRLLGPPTVLVNNAGVLKDRTLGKMTLDDWNLVVDVNLKGVFLLSREVAPAMREAGWGRIVNLSSIAALGVFGETNYSAAKAGVQGLTKTLAIELGPVGITANVVAPGFVETEMTRMVAQRAQMTMEELSALMMRDIVVGRTGIPDDIANAVSFFVDPRSSFVTGQVLYVAGAPRN